VEQVVLNLAVNARDAMADGGSLTIETRNLTVSRELAEATPGLQPNDYVVLQIGDTGSGMSPEVRARIFEPFYTTKGVNKGTGLGLSTVYGIVKQAEGYVGVTSGLGKGTTFSVYLPRSLEVPEPQKAERARRPSPTGVRVMVVEDEDPVRLLTIRMLERAGYSVAGFPSGTEALDAIRGGAGFDLLITDVVMPGLSGVELSRLSRLPTVFVSGYTDVVISESGVLSEEDLLVMKPFSSETLLDAVAQATGTIDDQLHLTTA
jgi:CheY-like chemotaxis protein